ncbi:MAG: DUF4917 family protein [Rhodospirillales bacterium]|nr:DUF4917 family protein [Rhodospirillales bacterium]
MSDVDVISFNEALDQSNTGKRHLLLGNGFSIALKPDIFTYEALYNDANFETVPHAEAIFDALDTRDFESVIKVLVDMSRVLTAYENASEELIGQIERDADFIKTILVNAIARRHPDRPRNVSEDEYAACRRFLSHFIKSKIYTLNYDVLLYWTLMHEDVDDLDLKCDDGFRAPEDDVDAPYVTWQDSHSPSVYFLHGALHLFDAGHELQKYTWSRTDIPIIEQIRAALNEDRFPLFVSEGHSVAKLTKIKHSEYLAKAARSLGSIGHNLFIFGHSMDESDDHILSLIEDSKVTNLFISIYGDAAANGNPKIIQRANQMATKRDEIYRGRKPLSIKFFDAESAEVWG